MPVAQGVERMLQGLVRSKEFREKYGANETEPAFAARRERIDDAHGGRGLVREAGGSVRRGDDVAAKKVVSGLIQEIGFAPVDQR